MKLFVFDLLGMFSYVIAESREDALLAFAGSDRIKAVTELFQPGNNFTLTEISLADFIMQLTPNEVFHVEYRKDRG